MIPRYLLTFSMKGSRGYRKNGWEVIRVRIRTFWVISHIGGEKNEPVDGTPGRC